MISLRLFFLRLHHSAVGTKVKSLAVAGALTLLAVSSLRASTIMYLDSVRTGPNQTVGFSLSISNDKPFVGFQLDLNYPSVLTFVNGSIQLTSRAADQSFSASVVSPGVLRIIVYSVSLTAFKGSSGAVLTLNFADGTTAGTYPIGIQSAIVADSASHNILTASYGGLFTLSAPRLNVSPMNLNFGAVPLHQNKVETVILENTGNVDLHISKLSINQSVFWLNDSSAVSLPANDSITINVNFGSLKKGAYTGTLTISSDDPAASTQSVTLNGIAFAVNELRIGSANGRSGYVFHLPVSINNMERFTSFEFKIALPSVAKFVSGSAHLSSRATDQVVAADTSGNILTVLAYSPSNSAFNDTGGVVLTMDFMVQGQGGTYALSPSDAVISDSTAANIISASYAGNLQVISPILSLNTDSIGYGSVSAKDTAKVTLIISNSGSDTLTVNSISVDNASFRTPFAAPVSVPVGGSIYLVVSFHSTQEGNHGGQITIRTNDSQHDPAYVSLSANVYVPNILSVVDGAGFKKESGLIAFDLENMKSIVGYQFDLQLPDSITPILDSIRLTSRKKDHVISASRLTSGLLRIIAYSPSLAPFSSDSGSIMELPVLLGDTAGTFQIHLLNVFLSDSSGKDVLTGENDGSYIIHSRKITATRSLNSSWNMISIPVVPDNYAVGSLFPNATSNAFGFNNIYVPVDTLHNQCGYWLKFDTSSIINITGLPIVADTFSVVAGWNLIGSISASVPVDSIIESPGGNVCSFYFGFNGGYRFADSLAPGMGYWVKASNAGRLILHTDPARIYLSSEPAPMISSHKKYVEAFKSHVTMGVNISFLDTLNYLKIVDADSFAQTLYFGRANVDSLALLRYELPPKPPDGAFDARFGSDRFLETLPQLFDSTDFGVGVQTVCYPITVHWHVAQTGVDYYLIVNSSDSTKRTRMSGDAEFVISDSSEHSFTLRCVSTAGPGDEIPLPINVVSVAAQSGHGLVKLTWVTQAEVNNAGFNVLRKTPVDNSFVLIANYSTDKALRGLGTSQSGRTYSFTDLKLKGIGLYSYKLQSVSTNGITTDINTINVTVQIPKNYSLYQNYPNPFNPSTTIAYDLPSDGFVLLKVYDILGKEVQTLVNEQTSAGSYQVIFDGTRFSTGMYFYRIQSGNFTLVKEMLLMK